MDNHFANKLGRYGEKVDFVREAFRSLNGGDVRIDKDCVNTLLLEGFDGLHISLVLDNLHKGKRHRIIPVTQQRFLGSGSFLGQTDVSWAQPSPKYIPHPWEQET